MSFNLLVYNAICFVMYMYNSHLNTLHFIIHVGPTGVPSDLRVVYANSSVIKFRWSRLECEKQNGPLIGYEYKICVDNKCIKGNVNSQTTTCTKHIQRDYGSYCTISVAATNEAGTGDHTPPVHVTNLASSVESSDTEEIIKDLSFNSQVQSKFSITLLSEQ